MTAPLFPLPNVVLFPDTWLPLHVFEPRYRRMVEDALEADGVVVIVLARRESPPGDWPAIHPLGTLARVEVAERLDDGRYHLAVRGLARVRIGSLEERPGEYFVGEIEARPETVPDLQDPEVAERRAGLLLAARAYQEQVLEDRYAGDYLHDLLPYPMLVNRAAAMLRVGVAEKQRLLAMDDLGERGLAVGEAMGAQIDAQGAVERFAGRRPERGSLN